MRIALLGTRGIPANYGGFETFYENLAPRLAERGHDVAVYNRPHAVGHRDLRTYRGVRLVHLRSVPTKHLDTITHVALSVLHVLPKRYDIVYVCGVGNASLAWVPRIGRAGVVLNVDSSDWRRAKWGRIASTYLKAMERLAGKVADVVVVDNQSIGRRYAEDHGIATAFVPYGANILRNEGLDALGPWGLESRKYVLWVGRLEPETRVEELITAFERAALPGFKLAIVGDAPFADAYKERLHSMATEDVVFTGRQHGDAYQQLSCHAFAYVQTSPTSGTSPALLDQMAFGNAVIARGTETNSEVVADAGLTYSPDNPVDGLADALRLLHGNPAEVARLREAAVERVRSDYSWEHITDVYEEMFKSLVARKRGGHRSR
jgi:glycosyltransferase involved in cell wall biosynthesis